MALVKALEMSMCVSTTHARTKRVSGNRGPAFSLLTSMQNGFSDRYFAQCSYTFRLRRLARNGCHGIGVRHFLPRFPHTTALLTCPCDEMLCPGLVPGNFPAYKFPDSYVCSCVFSSVCSCLLSYVCSFVLSRVSSNVLSYACSSVLSCVFSYCAPACVFIVWPRSPLHCLQPRSKLSLFDSNFLSRLRGQRHFVIATFVASVSSSHGG